MKSTVSFLLAFIALSCLFSSPAVDAAIVTANQNSKLPQQQDRKQEDEKKKQKEEKKAKPVVERRPAVVRAVPLARSKYTKAKFVGAKKFLVSQELTAHIENLERICNLDQKQKLKLSVAAKGHYLKFADQWIQENTTQFQHLFNRANQEEKPEEEKVIYKSVDEIDPATLRMVRTSRNRLYLGQQSPVEHPDWEKVLNAVLDEGQRASYLSFNKKKRAQLKSHQQTVAIGLLASRVDLADEQIEKIKALISPELDRFKRPPSMIDYEAHIAIYCLLQVEDELSEILSPAQKSLWDTVIAPYRTISHRIDRELAEANAQRKRQK